MIIVPLLAIVEFLPILIFPALLGFIALSVWLAKRAAAKRRAVLRDNAGRWLVDRLNQWPGKPVKLTPEMKRLKAKWKTQQGGRR